jgi:hypothetical protein
MVSMCLAIVGCTLIGAPEPAQAHPLQEVDLAAYLQHEDAKLRQSAVLILADAVLSVRYPHTGDPYKLPTQEMLFKMRASELPTLFDYLRDYWKKPLPKMDVHWEVRPAGHYEQLFRFGFVLNRMKDLGSFDFKKYVDTNSKSIDSNSRAISTLAMAGMFRRSTSKDQSILAGYLKGKDPLRTWAEHAADVAKFSPRTPLPTQDEMFPDNDVNKWAYDGLVNLANKGLVVSSNFRIGHIEHHRRYSVACAVRALFTKVDLLVSKARSDFEKIPYGTLPPKYAGPLKNLMIRRMRELNDLVTDNDLEIILRLIHEFKWELIELGEDPFEMRTRLRDMI